MYVDMDMCFLEQVVAEMEQKSKQLAVLRETQQQLAYSTDEIRRRTAAVAVPVPWRAGTA